MALYARPSLPEREGEPPWGEPGEWRRINRALAGPCAGRGKELEGPLAQARRLAAALEDLFPLLEGLCARTCPSCQDPCCLAARVWFDLPDLISLHLLKKPLPPGQTRDSLSQPCRYLTPTGCALPRPTRPWRCTWYLCSGQMELVSAWPPREQRRLSRIFQEALQARAALAEAFSRLVPEG